jgi:hypothetical protein
MPYKLITQCPVCSSPLKATKLTCSTCGTIIESEFNLSRFEMLTSEQLGFAEVFLKCRGIIKDVEKELGVSYPTVRARLDDVIKALGYKVVEEPASDITNIIDSLEKGEMSAEEAIKKIKK